MARGQKAASHEQKQFKTLTHNRCGRRNKFVWKLYWIKPISYASGANPRWD